MDHIFIFVITR